MKIEIREHPFDAYAEMQAFQLSLGQVGKYGAVSSFTGTMRDFNEGEEVSEMTLEHYPEMTRKHLENICNMAHQKWDLVDSLLIHRVGKIVIGDNIVLVAVWSAHRKDAFEACRFIMEDLKSKAPFWKQETLKSGKRWVKENTPG